MVAQSLSTNNFFLSALRVIVNLSKSIGDLKAGILAYSCPNLRPFPYKPCRLATEADLVFLRHEERKIIIQGQR